MCLYLVAEHQKQVCCVLAPGATAALFNWNNRILARSVGVLQPLTPQHAAAPCLHVFVNTFPLPDWGLN